MEPYRSVVNSGALGVVAMIPSDACFDLPPMGDLTLLMSLPL